MTTENNWSKLRDKLFQQIPDRFIDTVRVALFDKLKTFPLEEDDDRGHSVEFWSKSTGRIGFKLADGRSVTVANGSSGNIYLFYRSENAGAPSHGVVIDTNGFEPGTSSFVLIESAGEFSLKEIEETSDMLELEEKIIDVLENGEISQEVEML